MRISVVAPIYNEKDNIKRFINKVEKAVKKGFESYEIVLVDDGSTDGSGRDTRRRGKEKRTFKSIAHFTENNGQTAALDAGFKHCTGDLVLMMDSDLQTNPNDLYLLLGYLDNYDMVNGRRETREDGFMRKLSSFIGNTVRNFITNDDIKDTGCPLKLFKKKVVESFYLFEGMHRFLPTLAKINGFKVVEVPVRHYDREFGVSKYGVFNRLLKV